MKIEAKDIWLCWWVGSTGEFGGRERHKRPSVGVVFDNEQEAKDAIEETEKSNSIFGGENNKFIAQPLAEVLAEHAEAYKLYLKEGAYFYNAVNAAIYYINTLWLALAVMMALWIDDWMGFIVLLPVPLLWLSVTRKFRGMYWQTKEVDPDDGRRVVHSGFGAAYRAGADWEGENQQ